MSVLPYRQTHAARQCHWGPALAQLLHGAAVRLSLMHDAQNAVQCAAQQMICVTLSQPVAQSTVTAPAAMCGSQSCCVSSDDSNLGCHSAYECVSSRHSLAAASCCGSIAAVRVVAMYMVRWGQQQYYRSTRLVVIKLLALQLCSNRMHSFFGTHSAYGRSIVPAQRATIACAAFVAYRQAALRVCSGQGIRCLRHPPDA
jgi:hypothetical protein